LPGSFKAAHASHADIHEDKIGASLPGDIHGVGSIGGFTNHFDIGLGREQVADALAEQGVIVSQ